MKTLFLSGGSGDIGRAIKEKFKNKGYQIVAPSRKEMDLSSRGSVESYFENRRVEVDAVVHCAGVNRPKPFGEIAYDDIDDTSNVNTVSALRIIQYLSKCFSENGGNIVVVSSLYGIFARERRLPTVIISSLYERFKEIFHLAFMRNYFTLNE